ncbi:MAG: proline iminopeptidase [Pseudohongiellaceae bacterium]
MLPLYPEIKPYARHQLVVDDPHQLYIDESGNPDGIPVLFVHGGPGGGCDGNSRRFYDPEKYHIITYDQRGAGRSTPHAELRFNTTQHLIDDIEAIRQHLSIDRWMLFGGSWGSTLSLLYAQAYPERVMALVLRGIFLCRPKDLQWFYQYGAHHVFPDYWKDYIKLVADDKREDFISAYYDLLTGSNEIKRMEAAKAWSVWEGRCSTLRPNHDLAESFGKPHKALAMARIEAHYFVNGAFISDNQILDNANKLEGIPGIMVHGRYDMVCPLDNATALYDVWDGGELHIVRDAGHAASEPSIADALVRATEDMAKRLRPEDYL